MGEIDSPQSPSGPTISKLNLLRDLHQDDTMRRYFRRIGILEGAEIFVIQKIAQLRRGGRADGFEVERHLDGCFTAIKKSHGVASIGERLRPGLQRAFLPNAMSLQAFGVLIDSNDF